MIRIPASRRWVVDRAQEAGAGPGSLRIIALLASEAVTNAVQHSPEGGHVDLAVERREAAVRVSVRDDNPTPPVLLEVPPTAHGGRGVMLIDRLSDRWGVDPHPDGGKTVWFEVRA